jgi:hypothetical protein
VSKGTIWIDYCNHRGVRRWRQISVGALRVGSTEWHPKPQVLLDAVDLTPEEFSGVPPKGARTFAVKDIYKWSPDAPGPRMLEKIDA